MIQQLNPTIPVVTPRGKGNAVGWIDYGMEDDLYWIVFQADTCECWIYPNKDIRAQQNLTLGRNHSDPLDVHKGKGVELVFDRESGCLRPVPAGRPGESLPT